MGAGIIKNMLLAVLILASTPGISAAGIKGQYLFNLSNFHGNIPFDSVRVSIDSLNSEIYVTDGQVVRIFNAAGMEIYSFVNEEEAESVRDIVVVEVGDIVVLSHNWSSERGFGYAIRRCNYRGEPKGTIGLGELPPGFGGFRPYRMRYRQGLLYLASMGTNQVVVCRMDGTIEKTYDISSVITAPEEKRERQEVLMSGFNIDTDGNILFTVPVNFKAYRLSPDGAVVEFGKKGSAPGRFGIVSGIARDAQGNYYVTDKLRCVVIVFDKALNFVTEFGYRGFRPGNLISPQDVATDQLGRVYVTQLRKRGVSVYQVVSNGSAVRSDSR